MVTDFLWFTIQRAIGYVFKGKCAIFFFGMVINVMLGPNFHNQRRGLKRCTLGDKDDLHDEGKIRKKMYFVCKNHRELLPKH